MSLIIRPVDEEDKKNMFGKLKHTIDKATLSTESADSVDIFGKPEKVGNKEKDGSYTRMGYIDLTIPVVNFFLAGQDASIIAKITNNRFVEEFAKGNAAYNLQTGMIITAKDENDISYDKKNMLIGAEYIRYILSKFEPETELVNLLYKYVLGTLPVSVIKENGYESKDSVLDLKLLGSIVKGKGTFWLIDDYYFNPTIRIADEDDVRFLFDNDRVNLVKDHTSRITLLLALINNKDAMKNLRNEVMTFLPIIPIGYRSSMGGRVDKLTKAYNRVVIANNKLNTLLMYSGALLKDVRMAYQQLIAEIRNVMVKAGPYEGDDYKPLKERLGGKEGLIRSRMSGVRIDYTGRSVIIVDPYMSMDTIGLPRTMVNKLMESHVLKAYRTNSSNKVEVLDESKMYLKSSIAQKLIEDMYGCIGRQPTLYQLGIQGFKIKVVDEDAIVLSPLIVPAFNADFDGDQMHVNIPITERAQQEVKELMAVTNNLYLPRSGDCHIAPRQEILHGLWVCYKAEIDNSLSVINLGNDFEVKQQFVEDVRNQSVSIKNPVKWKDSIQSAGYVALKICLTKRFDSYRIGVTPLTEDLSISEGRLSESWFKLLMGEIGRQDKNKFVSIVNSLVRLGTDVCNIYPATVDILNYPDMSETIDEFDRVIEEREKLHQMGFESDEAYTAFYNKEYTKLADKVKKDVKAGLSDDNGYLQMVESGARGSVSNLVQMFGMKGRVMKNSDTAFNAIIRHPMASQLTGLEHFVTAYGSRQGIVDKVIATYKPGYLSRKMEHTTSRMVITSRDCMTKEGIQIDYDTLSRFVGSSNLTDDPQFNNKAVKDYFCKIVVGRYIVGLDAMIENEQTAAGIYDARVAKIENGKILPKSGIKLRSPITCKNPCCVKCYGKDLGKQEMVKVGTPIGFIAAQSIGEPGTQLTMKNFQNGGVAGVVNLTSSFDTVNDYLAMVSKRKSSDVAINYDFISPVEGEIRCQGLGNGTKLVGIWGLNNKGQERNKLSIKLNVYEGVKLKKYVKAGEGIQEIEGDHDIKEVMSALSPDVAQRYLALKLYDIFKKEVYINLKHFEVMVAGMTMYICTKGNEYFKTGKYYTIQEFNTHFNEDCEFQKTLIGIKEVPFYFNDAFGSLCLENIGKSIIRNVIVSGKDDLKDPLVRTAFGLPLGVGSDISAYMGGR